MRTLVVHNGGLGDFVLACPAVAALAEAGDVVLAGIRERVGLAVAAGIASHAADLDAIGFSSVFSDPNSRLVKFLNGFDRAVVWLKDDEGHIARAFSECGVGETHCFPGLPGPAFRKPAWRYYVECLDLTATKPPELPIAPAPDAPDVIIHPGSGGRKKCWDMDRFTSVGGRLEKEGYAVRMCTGPAEEDWTMPGELERLPRMDLETLAGTLAAAQLYIGNDSGVSHLAAAVGCPTVAIFGATDPRIWAPAGPNVRVLGSVSHWPAQADVLDAARGLLKA